MLLGIKMFAAKIYVPAAAIQICVVYLPRQPGDKSNKNVHHIRSKVGPR